MGNKNDYHVQLLETVPGLGFGIGVIHLTRGNIDQCYRAVCISTGTAFAVNKVMKYLSPYGRICGYVGGTITYVSIVGVIIRSQ